MKYSDEQSDIEHDQMRVKFESEHAKTIIRSAFARLEAVLAQKELDLLAYKDYYGTSLAQVKHLATCGQCLVTHAGGELALCPDYPTE